MFSETPQQRFKRLERQAEQYPELNVASPREVFSVDRFLREQGQQPTAPGRRTEDAYLERQGYYDYREAEQRSRPNPQPNQGRGGILGRLGDAASAVPDALGAGIRSFGGPGVDIAQNLVNRLPGQTREETPTGVMGLIDLADRPGAVTRGFLSGDNPADSVRRAYGGFLDPLGTDGQDLGFVRQLPEGSAARMAAGIAGEVLTDPTDLIFGAPLAVDLARGGRRIVQGMSDDATEAALRAAEGPLEASTRGVLRPAIERMEEIPTRLIDQIPQQPPLPVGTRANPEAVASRRWFHGTGTPDLAPEKLDPLSTRETGLVGQGIYLTDNPNIASGYATARRNQKGTPTIYQMQVRPNRILDLNEPAGAEIRDVMESVLRDVIPDGYGSELRSALDNPNSNGFELWQSMGESMKSWSIEERIPSYEFSDIIGYGVTEPLQRLGFDAYTHTGGLGKGVEHQVLILFDPNDTIGAAGRRVPVDEFSSFSPDAAGAPATRAVTPSPSAVDPVIPGVTPRGRANVQGGATQPPTAPPVPGFAPPPTVGQLYGARVIQEGDVRGRLEALAESGRRITLPDNPISTPALRVRDEAREAVRSRATVASSRAQLAIEESGFEFVGPRGAERIKGLENIHPDVPGMPTLRDVAARLDTYRPHLTPQQLNALDTIKAELAPIRQALEEVIRQEELITGKPSAINLGSRMDVEPGGFYIPRGKAETEELADIASRRFKGQSTGPRDGSEKTATFLSEAEGIENGWAYTPVDESIRSYIVGRGNTTLDRHTANYFLTRTDELGDPLARPAANADLRGAGRIAIRGLENYTFPWEIADDAARILSKENLDPNSLGAGLRAANSLARGIQASSEMSQFGIQMAMGMTTAPQAYARAGRASFEALGSTDTILARALARTDARDLARGLPDTNQWTSWGAHFGGSNTEFSVGGRTLPSAIQSTMDAPVIGKVLRAPASAINRFDTAFGVGGDTMRRELLSVLAEERALRGLPLDDAWGRVTAQTANRVTGWTPQRAFGSWGEMFNFAPRYLAARVRALGQLISTNPLKREQARRIVGRYVAIGTTMTILTNFYNGHDTDFRPFSGKNGPTYNPLEAEYKNPNFLRAIDVLNRDQSFLGPIDALAGIAIGIGSLITNPTGDPKEALNRMSVIFSSPLASLGIEWGINGEDFEGNQLTLSNRAGQINLLQRAMPFEAPGFAQSIRQAIEDGKSEGIAAGAREALGGSLESILGQRGSLRSTAEQRDDFLREEHGIAPGSLTSRERTAILASTDKGMEFLEAQEEDRIRRANNGDRTAMAMLVSTDMRNQFNAIAEHSETAEEYMRRTKPLRQQFIGERKAYADVFEEFRESDNPVERDVALVYDLIGEATHPDTGEFDFDLYEELEFNLIGEMGADRWDAAQEIIGMVDPRWNEYEIERRNLLSDLDATGFFDIRERAWEAVGSVNGLDLGGHTDYYSWRKAEIKKIEALFGEPTSKAQGLLIRDRAAKIVEKLPQAKIYERFLKPLQKGWEVSNPELLEKAIEYDYLDFNDFRRKILRVSDS